MHAPTACCTTALCPSEWRASSEPPPFASARSTRWPCRAAGLLPPFWMRSSLSSMVELRSPQLRGGRRLTEVRVMVVMRRMRTTAWCFCVKWCALNYYCVPGDMLPLHFSRHKSPQKLLHIERHKTPVKSKRFKIIINKIMFCIASCTVWSHHTTNLQPTAGRINTSKAAHCPTVSAHNHTVFSTIAGRH